MTDLSSSFDSSFLGFLNEKRSKNCVIEKSRIGSPKYSIDLSERRKIK